MKNISMTDDLFEFRNYILEDLIEKGYNILQEIKSEQFMLIQASLANTIGRGILK